MEAVADVVREQSLLSGAKGIEKLDIDGMSKVTLEDGSTFFISDNKRYVFRGEMVDLWSGTDISVEATSMKVNLNRNGVTTEKISLHFGYGNEELTVFIAPECPQCVDLVEMMMADESLKRFRFNAVLLDSSREGKIANQVVWCAMDHKEALYSVYVEGKQPASASAAGSDCDQFGLYLAKEAAKLFGIGQLPMIVNESGFGTVGVPESLDAAYYEGTR
jgi:thiol:disulfide interchange protein DsbC